MKIKPIEIYRASQLCREALGEPRGGRLLNWRNDGIATQNEDFISRFVPDVEISLLAERRSKQPVNVIAVRDKEFSPVPQSSQETCYFSKRHATDPLLEKWKFTSG